MTHPPYVLVSGPGNAGPDQERLAEQVGARLAASGAVVLTGGLGGAMAAAARGAESQGGLTVGLLPGTDRGAANPHTRVALPTGLGELRNGLLVRAADAVIAIGGGPGTLSEVALALKTDTRVVALEPTYSVDRVELADDPEDAVARALRPASGA